MIGKIIGVVLLLGVIGVGGIWLLTGKLPFISVDVNVGVDNGTESSTTTMSSSNASLLVYDFRIRVGDENDQSSSMYEFTVEVDVYNKSSSRVCYTYSIGEVKQGDRQFISDYMYGFQGYKGEGEIVCTNLATDKPHPGRFFAKPTLTSYQTISTSTSSGYYRIENGILTNLQLHYNVEENNTTIPVTLNIDLASYK